MFQAAYRFFDQAFVLESDSPSFLARFDAAYGRFRQATAAARPGTPINRVVLGGQPEAIIAGQRVTAADAQMLELYATSAILHAATAQVHSHYLLHAAALRTPDGMGAILAGAGGLGKTTLTLALLRRGWGLLSDDVAAVERAGGRLDPFPRSLGVRMPGGRPGEKRLIEAEAIAQPCPARFLFLLGDPRGGRAADDPWYLSLDRADEAVIDELAALAGVRRARLERGGPFAVVRLDLAAGGMAGAEAEIEAACRRRGVLVLDLVQGQERAPDFGGEPCLEPMAAAEAGRELLAHLRGGRRAAVLREAFGGSAARLYLALVDLAGRMDCFRLAVGRLEAMIEAIERATGRGAARRGG